MLQSTHWPPALFFFSKEIWPIPKAKNTKSIKASKKMQKNTKRAGGQYLCTCGSNTGLKFQSKIIKIGRGIAVMPLLSLLLDLSIESSSLGGWRTTNRL